MNRFRNFAGAGGHAPERGSGYMDRILALVRQRREIARVDIVNITGISAATVTTLTARLMELNLIEEVSADHLNTPRKGAGRGRPRQLLRLKSNSHLVLGVRISHEDVWVVLMDYSGRLIAQEDGAISVNADRDVEDLLEECLAVCDRLLAREGLSHRDLSSIGLALPGVVDPGMNLVHWSPLFSSRAVNVKDRLEKRLGLPVFLENDANLLALAENWFGLGQSKSDYLVVSVEGAVGVGVLLNNELFRGARGLGAVIGHVTVAPDGALCQCGRKGCLDAYLSGHGLAREMRARGEDVPDTITLRYVLESRAAGSTAAIEVLDLVTDMLGLAVGNLITLFDPSDVIFSCPKPGLTPFFAEVSQAMQKHMLRINRPQPRIVTHDWNDYYWGKGAAALALDGLTKQLLATA